MRVDSLGGLVAEDGDPPVEHFPSMRHSPLVVSAPLGVVWHWTGYLFDARATAKRIATYARGRDRAASWHVLIARDGAVLQSVRLQTGAWHVRGRGMIAGRMRPVNGCTVGIELENAGKLHDENGALLAQVGRDWRPLPLDRTATMTSTGTYEDFTAAQVSSATRVLTALVERFGWHREVCGYGHSDFTQYKLDPGPLWRDLLPGIIDAAMGGEEG